MELIRDCTCCENHLLPGEEIEWKSRPGTFPLLTKDSKGSLLLRWILCAAILVAITVLYAIVAQNKGVAFNYIVELILVIAAVYISITPILDWKKLQKKTCYYVTNKRIILMSGSNLYALNRAGINMKWVPADDDSVHILFGACQNKPSGTWRRYAIAPDPQDFAGFVFYGVQVEKDRLKELLSV